MNSVSGIYYSVNKPMYKLSVELDKLVTIADEAARIRGAAPGTPIVSVLSKQSNPLRVSDDGTINMGKLLNQVNYVVCRTQHDLTQLTEILARLSAVVHGLKQQISPATMTAQVAQVKSNKPGPFNNPFGKTRS